MRPLGLVVMAGLLVGPSAAWMEGAAKAPLVVEVRVAKYQDLCNLVAANKGKVVVIDFWALTCPPCKRAFPHTVKLHTDQAANGLAVISVSNDSLEQEPEKIKRLVLAFLQKNEAVFPNLILDEPDAVIREKLRIESLPCMYVFNRAGKWRQFMSKDLVADAQGHYPDFEAYVEACLREPVPK